MKKLPWILLLLLCAGCGYHVNGNTNQIQLAIYTPLCVDVMDASTVSGARIQIYPCGSGKRSQEWIIRPIDAKGDVMVINVNSAMCMAIQATPVTAPGQYVIQETCVADGSQLNQVWNVAPAPGQKGSRFVSLASNQCLDLPYGATASIFPLQQYTCTQGDPAQGWVLNPVSMGSVP